MVSGKTDNNTHVLIIGAGIVGLTIAQGCRENGIPFTIFERDRKGTRAQGWALTLHWGLRSLERTISAELSRKLNTTLVDPTVKHDEGNFLFLNTATGTIRFKAPLSNPRIRVQRQKFRELLAMGIDVQGGKHLEAVEELPEGGVRAHFKDGTTATGSMLIGADGNNSAVRKVLLGSQAALTHLPVNLLAVVRNFSAEQAQPVRALDPLLFQSLDPNTGNYLWFSTQAAIEEAPGRYSFDAFIAMSYILKDEEPETIPPTNHGRVQAMKSRASGFAEPLRSIVMDIDENTISDSKLLKLADFPTIPWDNKNGRITLAGDAAHAMTMYRGEGANHGILDAALIIDQLKKVMQGSISQKEALDTYEAEMIPRGHAAVLLSRQATFDAHNWDALTLDSPSMGPRVPPPTA